MCYDLIIFYAKILLAKAFTYTKEHYVKTVWSIEKD